MKKIFIFIAVMTAYSFGFSQNIIDKHFSHYKNQDNITSVSISGKMFQIASQIELEVEGKDTKQLQDMVSRIESFNMIVGEEMPDSKSDYKQGISKVQTSHEELMRVNNKEGNFMVKIDEQDGLVREVIMIGQSEKNFIAFSLMGRIQLDELGEVISEINDHGLDEIENIFDNKIDEFKVYPNPSKNSSDIRIDIPEEMLGARIVVTDMNGKLIGEYPAESSKEQLRASNLKNGSYIIQLVKDDVKLTKKFIILD